MDLRRGVTAPALRLWRTRRVLTQAELARRAHVSRGTIIAAEHGRRIQVPKAARLARALGVTRETLVVESANESQDKQAT